jgi:hypothetical protein
MPAVQLSLLRKQIETLLEAYEEPGRFLQRLQDLFSRYADRTFRLGDTGEVQTLLKSYQVPPQIMSYIKGAVVAQATAAPRSTADLCDTLWADGAFESRILAIHLLSLIPLTFSEIIYDRAKIWAATAGDAAVLETLLKNGLEKARKQDANAYLSFLDPWLESAELEEQRIGLLALIPLVRDPGFENLPAVYRMLTPICRSAPAELIPFLQETFIIFIQRSAAETAYFLRQIVLTGMSTRTHLLVRLLLPEFPEKYHPGLRAVITDGV